MATDAIGIVLEAGGKRAFASAIDWPGWARGGRTPDDALAALAAYGPRYGAVVRAFGSALTPPDEASGFVVMERVAGNATTEFGAPGVPAEVDERPLDRAGLDRQIALLRAAWRALDAAAAAAEGVVLRTGPRGGGRDLAKMLGHVHEAERAYLGQLGLRAPAGGAESPEGRATLRDAVVTGLEAVAAGAVPREKAGGGRRWSVRYFVRRAAWHVLDHAWEIEDRATPAAPPGPADPSGG